MQRFYTLLSTLLLAITAMAQTPATTVLTIDECDPVTLYSDSYFSQPGAYDYYFFFYNSKGDYRWPWVAFDLFMPTDEGLTEGTYTMTAGTVNDEIVIVQNDDDYMWYQMQYLAYDITEATVKLTHNEGDNWTIDFSCVADDGVISFTYTGDLTFEEDTTSPGGGDEPTFTYKYEPTGVETYNLTFDEITMTDWTDDGYDLVEFNLRGCHQVDKNGRAFEALLDFFTESPDIPAGTYRIDFSEKLGTWLASYGCSVDHNSLDYPSYIRTYDDEWYYETWYFDHGDMTIGRDDEGNYWIGGTAVTHNGSTVNLAAGNVPTGINTVIADTDPQAGSRAKMLRHGDIIVRHGADCYNLHGKRIK